MTLLAESADPPPAVLGSVDRDPAAHPLPSPPSPSPRSGRRGGGGGGLWWLVETKEGGGVTERWRIGRGARLSGGVTEWWGSVAGGWRRLRGRWLGDAKEVAAVHTGAPDPWDGGGARTLSRRQRQQMVADWAASRPVQRSNPVSLFVVGDCSTWKLVNGKL